jgi:hypothetical protein
MREEAAPLPTRHQCVAPGHEKQVTVLRTPLTADGRVLGPSGRRRLHAGIVWRRGPTRILNSLGAGVDGSHASPQPKTSPAEGSRHMRALLFAKTQCLIFQRDAIFNTFAVQMELTAWLTRPSSAILDTT